MLGDYGAAPAFVTNGTWFNTEGLSAAPGQTSHGRLDAADAWTAFAARSLWWTSGPTAA